ncbi:HpcH/HpaI aldolase/citrate lyase family protein [Amycolatopsis deserti]|nr:CoA ester lyase [Amycolatopsis deserti]
MPQRLVAAELDLWIAARHVDIVMPRPVRQDTPTTSGVLMFRSTTGVAHARSLLFVPAHRPELFEKAYRSGADAIVMDLEDGVAENLKDSAREHVREWIANDETAVVRINGPDTRWFEEDLRMVQKHQAAVMIPKPQSASEVLAISKELPDGSCIIPLLETAAGILAAAEICRVQGVARAAFGNGDMALDLGADGTSWPALLHARSTIVTASAAAGIAGPLDGATTSLTDQEILREDSVHARALGFTGRICVHPSQVRLVNDAFTPTDAEAAHARAILDKADGGSVTALDGKLIGKPMVERARQTLRNWERHRSKQTQDT